MKILFLSLVAFLAAANAGAATCNWCVFGNQAITADVVGLSKLPPKKLLAELRSRKVCVKVMDTHRVVPRDTFVWGKVEKPKVEAKQVSKLVGLMGKTLCADELPVAKGCTTIMLASDAPFVTAIHEYLHVMQAKRDASWCPFSKSLWTRGSNESDFKRLHDKEWDVHLFLWYNRKKMPLSLEDKIAVATETANEAELRKAFDPDAEKFLAQENIQEYVRSLITDYKTQMGIKK